MYQPKHAGISFLNFGSTMDIKNYKPFPRNQLLVENGAEPDFSFLNSGEASLYLNSRTEILSTFSRCRSNQKMAVLSRSDEGVYYGGSYMSPFWNHILGFVYVEIAKIAAKWKLANTKKVWTRDQYCAQSSLSLHPPAHLLCQWPFFFYTDRIHMNSYVRNHRSPGIWIHTF